MLVGTSACQTATLTGDVRDAAGTPVAGAVLSSPGCEAVSDEAGRFRVSCETGPRTFAVRHPAYLQQAWDVSPRGGIGDEALGTVTLAPLPLESGLWLASGDLLAALPEGPFDRTATDAEQRWCMDAAQGQPTVVPAGKVRLLDNHGVDWRLYRLDAQGCAYRLTRTAGSSWAFAADALDVPPGEPLGPGRTWLDLPLEPGDYALAEWYGGFLVRDAGERFRAHWLRVAPEGPTASAG